MLKTKSVQTLYTKKSKTDQVFSTVRKASLANSIEHSQFDKIYFYLYATEINSISPPVAYW